MPLTIAVAVFLLGLTTIVALYLGLNEHPRGIWFQKRGAQRYTAANALAPSSLHFEGFAGVLLEWWVKLTGGGDKNTPEVQRIRLALNRAGVRQVEQLALYRAARVACFVLLLSAGFVLSRSYPRYAVTTILGGAIVGYVLPGYLVGRMAQRRQRMILHELPAILDLLVVTLEAGQGLLEAIKIVGRETSRQGRVLGGELATAAAEMGAGLSLELSMRNLAERTGVEELKSVAAVLIQNKEIGGSLGPSLRAASELLSAKRRLKAEEAAQKTSVKMLLPLVLLILPAMMLIILGPAIIQIVELMRGSTL